MRKVDYSKIILDIQKWIKEYVYSANAKGVVLGLSGGIDSATIAALCVNSLGKENIIGLGLPIESVPQDLEDAKAIAKYLGITFLISDLTSVYKEFLEVLPSQIKSNKIAFANIKPRLRMTMIYFIGQSLGDYLVAGTGNRSELAIGYFTKYGDGGVDFEPIGALYKCEVREVARALEIPDKIINKIPSAGLWEGQTDEDEIGLTYELLDEILYRIDHYLGLEDLNEKDVKKVINMMKSAEHKTKMPPMFQLK